MEVEAQPTASPPSAHAARTEGQDAGCGNTSPDQMQVLTPGEGWDEWRVLSPATECERLVVKESALSDAVLRAVASVLLRVANRPCALDDLRCLALKFSLAHDCQAHQPGIEYLLHNHNPHAATGNFYLDNKQQSQHSGHEPEAQLEVTSIAVALLDPIPLLTKLNEYFKQCRAMRKQPIFKRVVINECKNYYYLDTPCLPDVTWIKPPLQESPSLPIVAIAKAAAFKHKLGDPAYGGLTRAEKKRILYGDSGEVDSMDEGDDVEAVPIVTSQVEDKADEFVDAEVVRDLSSKQSKMLHKRVFGGDEDDDTETDDDNDNLSVNELSGGDLSYPNSAPSSNARRTPGSSAPTTNSPAGNGKRNRRGLNMYSRCNLKEEPPYTDLVVTDPLPFVPSAADPSVNALLLPSNLYYHVQDDRCMNRKRYADFPKCRSCIWKHRERLPHCFFMGFRAFLVQVAPQCGRSNEHLLGEGAGFSDAPCAGNVSRRHGRTSSAESTEAMDLSIVADALVVSDSLNDRGRHQSQKLPFETDPKTPYMVITQDLQADDILYGPYFIPGGTSFCAMAPANLVAASQKKAPSTGSQSRKRGRDSPVLSTDEAELLLRRPAKMSTLRRHKSLGSGSIGGISLLDEGDADEDANSTATPSSLSRVGSHAFKSISRGTLSSNTTATATPAKELDRRNTKSIRVAAAAALASSAKEVHDEENAQDEGPVVDDFPDLVVTDPFPFVPNPADATQNLVALPPNTPFHIQDEKCLSRKKYANFPKCRSCRWKHRDRLPYCFYVGFRAFLLENVPLPAGLVAASMSKLGGKDDNDREKEAAADKPPDENQGGTISEDMGHLFAAEMPFRYLGDVEADNLIYGPYFVPGGVPVEGHVIATVGPKRAVGGRGRRKRGGRILLSRSGRFGVGVADAGVATGTGDGEEEEDDAANVVSEEVVVHASRLKGGRAISLKASVAAGAMPMKEVVVKGKDKVMIVIEESDVEMVDVDDLVDAVTEPDVDSVIGDPEEMDDSVGGIEPVAAEELDDGKVLDKVDRLQRESGSAILVNGASTMNAEPVVAVEMATGSAVEVESAPPVEVKAEAGPMQADTIGALEGKANTVITDKKADRATCASGAVDADAPPQAVTEPAECVAAAAEGEPSQIGRINAVTVPKIKAEKEATHGAGDAVQIDELTVEYRFAAVVESTVRPGAGTIESVDNKAADETASVLLESINAESFIMHVEKGIAEMVDVPLPCAMEGMPDDHMMEMDAINAPTPQDVDSDCDEDEENKMDVDEWPRLGNELRHSEPVRPADSEEREDAQFQETLDLQLKASCELLGLAGIALAVGEVDSSTPPTPIQTNRSRTGSKNSSVSRGNSNNELQMDDGMAGNQDHHSPLASAIPGAVLAELSASSMNLVETNHNEEPNMIAGGASTTSASSTPNPANPLLLSSFDKYRAKELAAKIRGALLDGMLVAGRESASPTVGSAMPPNSTSLDPI
ncbi:hypothetical protein BC830DRAFT_1095959 [Chytriomyces sp. MP71]|nr:hypothetical protein BC830DRAFT_1095959 [Chytriomyces sp. MP71]